MKLTKKQVILARLETVYGNDSVPTKQSHAVLAADLRITPMEGRELTRSFTRNHLGSDQKILAGVHVSCSFSVELAASGQAGVPPAWDILLKGCGFAQVVDNSAKSVTYKPRSESFDSLSIYINRSGRLHKMLGARGSFVCRLDPGTIPRLDFRFLGLWVDPAAVRTPSVDLTAWTVPLEVSAGNTKSISFAGVSHNVASLSVDVQNQLEYQSLINAHSIEIVDRNPVAQISIQDPLANGETLFAAAKLAQTKSLAFIHGKGAGNEIGIYLPKIQIHRPEYQDAQGMQKLSFHLVVLPFEGNDEIQIVCK